MSAYKEKLMSIRIKLLKILINLNERLIFERKLFKFYKKKTACNLVFDIGANQGQTIDFFLRINSNCEIYAFEPNRRLYQLLVKKYEKYPNVKLFMIGISDLSGLKTFYENIFDFTSTFEEVNEASVQLQKKRKILGVKSSNLIKDTYNVEVITLSSFINKMGINKIDVLKIDTEGHELACLKGLFVDELICDIDFIQTEKLNGDMYNSNFSEILTYLKSNKFLLETEIKHGFGNFEDVVFRKKS
jgi:FkbM family methyltransferase